MTVESTPARFESDPAIAGSDLVLPDLGATATARYLEVNGWQLEASRPVQLLYSPGRSALVRRAVVASRSGTERRFSITTEARRKPTTGVPDATSEHFAEPIVVHPESVRTWAFPFDPWLPGLPQAITIAGARRIAEAVTGHECSVHASVVRYRPGRRAVLRYVVRKRRSGAPRSVFYVKALRPTALDTATRAAAVIRHLDDRYAVPLSASPCDVLVYRNLPGRPLRAALLESSYGDLPSRTVFGDVMRELSTLAAPPESRAGSAAGRLRSAAKLISTVAPHLQSRVANLATQVDNALRHESAPRIVVHGDLYEAQILVGDGGTTAVLDLDDLGLGDPAMDAGNVSAHLVALAESHPLRGRFIDHYRSMIRDDLRSAAGIDEPSLRAREAVAMLQLATGPLRVLVDDWPDRMERRLALAEAMLQPSSQRAA